jgi:hypothetical protein
MTKSELIDLVKRIIAAQGTEEEIDGLITLLEQSVPHPRVSDLIYYPEREMTAEEIVDAALSYRPISL